MYQSDMFDHFAQLFLGMLAAASAPTQIAPEVLAEATGNFSAKLISVKQAYFSKPQGPVQPNTPPAPKTTPAPEGGPNESDTSAS